MDILISSKESSAIEVQEMLAVNSAIERQGIQLGTRTLPFTPRGMDPTVVVAVVTATSAALSALISGLVQISQQKKARTVVIQSRQGSRIEVPIDISEERLSYYVEKVREMDLEGAKIQIP